MHFIISYSIFSDNTKPLNNRVKQENKYDLFHGETRLIFILLYVFTMMICPRYDPLNLLNDVERAFCSFWMYIFRFLSSVAVIHIAQSFLLIILSIYTACIFGNLLLCISHLVIMSTLCLWIVNVQMTRSKIQYSQANQDTKVRRESKKERSQKVIPPDNTAILPNFYCSQLFLLLSINVRAKNTKGRTKKSNRQVATNGTYAGCYCDRTL